MSVSMPKQDVWYTQLTPKTAAGRRFLEFCKQDYSVQQLDACFDRDLYIETVRYVLNQVDSIRVFEQDVSE